MTTLWFATLAFATPVPADAPVPAVVAPAVPAEGAPAEGTPTEANPAPDAVPADAADDLANEVARLKAENAALRGERAAAEPRVTIGEDLLIAAGEVVEDAVVVGADLRVEGTVLGDATSVGGKLVVGPQGSVAGDAVALFGGVTVEDGGSIAGDRVDVIADGFNVDVGDALPASAAGSLVRDATQALGALAGGLLSMVTWLGLGLLIVGLMPERVGRIGAAAERAPLSTALVGALSFAGLGTLSILIAAVTLGLGLPVSFLLWAALASAWLLGSVALCTLVGQRLDATRLAGSRWLAFVAGSVVWWLATEVPWLGWVAWTMLSCVSLGASLRSGWGTR